MAHGAAQFSLEDPMVALHLDVPQKLTFMNHLFTMASLCLVCLSKTMVDNSSRLILRSWKYKWPGVGCHFHCTWNMVINAKQTPLLATSDGLKVPVHDTTFHRPASFANIWILLPIGHGDPETGGKVASTWATILYILKEIILGKQSFCGCQKANACIHWQSASKNTYCHLTFQSRNP